VIPVLFQIPEWIPLLGGQPITSFGVMLLAAFLAAGKLFVDAVRADAPDARGWDLVVTAAVAGLLGAKALHLAVNGLLDLPTSLGRAGMNGFGGLVAGSAAVLWQARAQGLDMGRVAAAAAAPLALGYAVGRIGSFLVGSEYGVPTAMPWGVTFPAGAPPTTPVNLLGLFGAESPAGAMRGDYVRVHPTQLYEAALSLGIFWAVRRDHRRDRSRTGGWNVAGLYLVLYGAARLLMEPVRAKSDHLVGPVTVDMLLAAAVLGIGVWLRRMHGAGNRTGART
jgi:phosphatidylglycerol---prolipoprotein diacylglyceryl transferase